MLDTLYAKQDEYGFVKLWLELYQVASAITKTRMLRQLITKYRRYNVRVITAVQM
jgi:hypothetical protein